MKRLLHALAALWPWKTIPLRTRPTACESADSRICTSAHQPMATARDLSKSTTKRISESSRIGEVLEGLSIRTDRACKFADLPIRELANESATSRISESAKEIHPTDKTIFHLNRRYCNVLAYIALFMCLTAAKQVSAQAEPAAAAEIKPLEIGDSIPEALWHLPLQVVNHPEGRETITLNDYRGKLIILDFWATWCVPCITSLHKLDTLQQSFAEEVVILPATYESMDKAMGTFAKHGWQLPTLVGDMLLKLYFPHRTVPHHVWINNGKMLMATYPEYANGSNIQSVLDGGIASLLPKEQTDSPLLVEPLDTLYQVVITTHNNAMSPSFRRGDLGFTATNLAIPELYRSAFYQRLPYSGWLNRIIIEVDSSSLQLIKRPASNLIGDYQQDNLLLQWNNDNTYCYQSSFSQPIIRDMLFVQMQRDLNTFFGRHLGIVGRMETRRILCLVLSHNGITPTYMAEKSQPAQFKKNPGKLSVSRYPMNDFVERLATTNRHLPTPIINGTGYEGPVNIDINTDLQDIQRINRQLNSYGLELSTDYHDVDVLVITNTNQTF